MSSPRCPRMAISKPIAWIWLFVNRSAHRFEALEEANVVIINLIERHIAKDWGDLSDDDKRLNDEALHDGSRILSAYILPSDVKVWIITEAADDNGDRAATTALLPEEY